MRRSFLTKIIMVLFFTTGAFADDVICGVISKPENYAEGDTQKAQVDFIEYGSERGLVIEARGIIQVASLNTLYNEKKDVCFYGISSTQGSDSDPLTFSEVRQDEDYNYKGDGIQGLINGSFWDKFGF